MRKITILGSVCFFMLCCSVAWARPTILVIESYHAEYPWDKSYKEGLAEVLGAENQLVFFEMDTKRVPKSEYPKRAELAWKKYQDLKPDLVILGDDNAVSLLGARFLKTKTPVVYLGVNRNPRDYGLVGHPNVTGVMEKPLLRKSIHTLHSIVKPPPRKVLVLFDNGTTSQAAVSEDFEGKTVIDILGVSVKLELIGDLDKWKQVVTDAKTSGYDAIVIGLYHTVFDKNNKHVDAAELLHWTVNNSPVPYFGFWDFSVGSDKTIGGFVLFGKTQGQAAGEMAKKILAGTPPAEIPPKIGEKGRFYFSKSRLKQWHIDLPPAIAAISAFTD